MMIEKSTNQVKTSTDTAEASIRVMSDINDAADIENNSKKSDEDKKTRFPKIKKLNEIREANTEKYKKLSLFLMIIFPLFICTMAETTQAKGFMPFLDFVIDRPTVLVFDVIITAIIFIFLLAIFKKGWLAVTAHSILFMALSTTELFKYGTNGNHLILSDMKLFKSVKSLKSFAYIKITPRLVFAYLIVIAFVLLIFYLNPKFKLKPLHRVATAVGCILPCAALIIFPVISSPVYAFFKIDTTDASNDMLLKEKFNKNGFLAFLVQTASEDFENRLVPPDEYTEDKIHQIMNVDVDSSGDFNGGVKPNVILIMSESFADFRVFDELDVDKKYYEYFDKACNEGHSGTVITPTYASWTVRSEFELMFGLPVRALNDPNMPQRELAEGDLPAMAHYYNSWGYNTAYIHPFQSGFYSRNKIYDRFGYKNMIFHDDLDGVTDFTVDVEHYGTYVDDSSVFNQIIDLIKNSDEPLYAHTTTMQNHQPYDQGENPDDEFGNYLQWIQHSNENLDVFLNSIKEIDEPTIVFFVGDHFPSLRGETSVYNQLGLTGENCSVLYEQKYFIWSNYDADFSSVPDKKLSFFYVPYIILDVIDAPHDAFIEKMMYFMDTVPVYSTSYNNETPRNEELDILTYDRAAGERYSPSPITENGD